VIVHLIDGTYELFRHYYALPKAQNATLEEIAAARGVVVSLLGLLDAGATHVAVATDHVIESFRNRLWPGYKDGSGIEPDLWRQFAIVEDVLRDFGFVVWPMVEFEADDALAAGARLADERAEVERVLICTPDKDLAQCVRGTRVVQFDRRRRAIIDEDAVRARFGVGPASIPDWLALVGDSADGYPGVPGWGAKSAAAVLSRYERLDEIPRDASAWDVDVRGAARLADALNRHRDEALLFRRLATLDRSAPVSTQVEDLRWTGPAPGMRAAAERLAAPDLAERAERMRR
jgi:5'-3' exonuclease